MEGPHGNDSFGVDDGFPLCMVVLDKSTHRPVKANQMFEECMGPIFKFANYQFFQAASDDDDGKEQNRLSEAIQLVASGEEKRTRVRNVEMITLAGEAGLPIRKRFDWFIGNGSTSSDDDIDCEETLILLGDPVVEVDIERREKDAELIDFFQNAPIALHWLSGQGIVLWANKTEMSVLGYTPEEYIGQPIMKFCPDEEEIVLEIFKQLGSGNSIKDVPVRFRTKDGKLVYLLIDSNVKYDKDGSFGHTRCFIRDDTGRKVRDARTSLLIEETKRSLNMLEGFMSKTLHFVRTPLHLVQSICDSLHDSINQSEKNSSNLELQDLVKTASICVKESVSTINDIADLSKFDQGSIIRLRPELVCLESFGREVLDSLPSARPGVNFSLELVGGEFRSSNSGPGYVTSDPSCLQRALTHLLLNSIKSTKEGSICLKINYKSGRCTFTITDTGPGMEMAPDATSGDLPRVFQKYYENSSSDELQSNLEKACSVRDVIDKDINSLISTETEIGLSLSYHLIQALGAELRCKSIKGKGTEFWFSLPMTASKNASVPQSPLVSVRVNKRSVLSSSSLQTLIRKADNIISSDSEEPMLKKRRAVEPSFDIPKDILPHPTPECIVSEGVLAIEPPSVLVVEDTIACAKILSRILVKFGCSVKVAENGKVAIDILKNSTDGTFNLILMDLRMPEMDGLEATKIIKDELKLSIPVIALTAETSDGVRAECDSIGFDNFQNKPLKRNTLKQLLNEFAHYDVK